MINNYQITITPPPPPYRLHLLVPGARDGWRWSVKSISVLAAEQSPHWTGAGVVTAGGGGRSWRREEQGEQDDTTSLWLILQTSRSQRYTTLSTTPRQQAMLSE